MSNKTSKASTDDPKAPLGAESSRAELVAAIRTQLKALHAQFRPPELPERIEGAAVLHGRRVVMVDDLEQMLAAFVPALMVATGGKALFLHHRDETLEELCDALLAMQPEVALLDYHLACGVDGAELAGQLKMRAPHVTVLGFSTDSSAEEVFRDAGADGFITKAFDEPERCVAEIAAAVEQYRPRP